VRFAVIAKCANLWPLWLCAAFRVTRGGYYAWLRRPESERAKVDTRLTAAISVSFAESDQTYGSRRVHRDLRAWGHRCGRHRVERLMCAFRPRRTVDPVMADSPERSDVS
jgi:putative transposase